jgi:adenylate kinase
MDLKTAILIGPSGCGKGTQAVMLKEYLEKNDPERNTLHLQTGKKVREFIQGDSYIQKKVKHEQENGVLMAAFLPIVMWGELFIEKVTGNDHILCDGFPRRAEESPLLHSAFEFLERKNPTVISFEIEDEVIIDRLVNVRKRFDDTPETVAQRLQWFRRDVSLAIRFFEEHSYYTVAHINGDQSVEAVHKDILSALELE